ncbi:hypothetical protein Tco_1384198 [Tanacetum coccineum]
MYSRIYQHHLPNSFPLQSLITIIIQDRIIGISLLQKESQDQFPTPRTSPPRKTRLEGDYRIIVNILRGSESQLSTSKRFLIFQKLSAKLLPSAPSFQRIRLGIDSIFQFGRQDANSVAINTIVDYDQDYYVSYHQSRQSSTEIDITASLPASLYTLLQSDTPTDSAPALLVPYLPDMSTDLLPRTALAYELKD